MQNTRLAGSGRISYGRLPLVALIAALSAAVANALIYYAVSGIGLIPQGFSVPTPYGQAPLTMVQVVVSSAVGIIGATMVFAVIGWFARSPVRPFRIIATAVLALSFAGPATIPGAPVTMVLALGVMHVVVWAASVVLLTTLARRETGA